MVAPASRNEIPKILFCRILNGVSPGERRMMEDESAVEEWTSKLLHESIDEQTRK